jgi:hypothetical protein
LEVVVAYPDIMQDRMKKTRSPAGWIVNWPRYEPGFSRVRVLGATAKGTRSVPALKLTSGSLKLPLKWSAIQRPWNENQTEPVTACEKRSTFPTKSFKFSSIDTRTEDIWTKLTSPNTI